MFTHSAGSSHITCILLHRVRGFGSWDLGTGFIIIIRPWVYYGLIIGLDDRLWLWHITLHINESFIGNPCRLVAHNCWCCMLMARRLGCCPRCISRLGCGLKARRLGCYPKHFSCPGRCLHSCRWLAPICVPCISISFANPFGVSTTCEWEVSALERTCPGLDHFLVWGSCSLTDWVCRNCGSSLACMSCMLYTCLVCGEALAGSLFAEGWWLGRSSSAVYSAVTQHSLVLQKRKLISYYCALGLHTLVPLVFGCS